MTYNTKRLDEQERLLFKEERSLKRLDGWFIIRENIIKYEKSHKDMNKEITCG